MRILYTNYQLINGTGTEQVIRDLASTFQNKGNEVAIYCPRQGDMAEQIRSHGIRVLSRLEELPWEPDIIHGQHHVETLDAVRAFPEARGCFVCHDARAWHDYPPRHPRLLAYIAVDLNCRERLEAAGISDSRIIGNWVDLHRFHRRASLPSKPRRALIFSNYAAAGGSVDAIQAACRDAGIDCSVIGQNMQNRLERPEEKLGDFDLVFAKGKCAFEAMATGASVILYHADAIGPMITTQNMVSHLPWNFGMRLITSPIQQKTLREQIDLFDPVDSLAVADWVRKTADMEKAIEAYQNLYNELRDRSLLRKIFNFFRHRSSKEHGKAISPAAPSSSDAPLKPESMRAVHVHPLYTPASVRLGEYFPVEIEIRNDSGETLSSTGRFPVKVSYHWRNAAGEIVLYEGLRSEFPVPLAPHSNTVMWLLVFAPEYKGPHFLQLTCVQEYVLWFDQVPDPSLTEIKIDVMGSGMAP